MTRNDVFYAKILLNGLVEVMRGRYTMDIRGLGAHMPIGKGFHVAPELVVDIGGNAFQIFPHSPRSWKGRIPTSRETEKFNSAMSRLGIDYDNAFVHSGYLVNLAAPSDETYEKSINCMILEIEICAALGLKYLNVHPGSHRGEGEKFGIARIQKALDRILEETQHHNVMILLEIVAPKGGNLGYTIEQLSIMRNGCSRPERIGITFDTCHGFDAGYDITSEDGVKRLLDEVERYVGLENLKMIHLNDSKYPLGAGKDRHEFIGQGYIGDEGFATFFSFDEIRKIPWILETPGGIEEYRRDIQRVKEILKKIR